MAGDRQKTSPWSETQRNLQLQMWRDAQAAYRNTPKDAYTGNINVGPSGATKDYLSMLGQAASAPRDYGAAEVRNLAGRMGTDQYLNPDSNPYLRQSVDYATQGVANQFNRSTLPGLQSRAIAEGAYGGSRAQVGQGLAQSEALRNSQGIAAGMYNANYQAERDRMLQGQLAAPGMYNTAAQLSEAQIGAPLGYAQQRGQLTDQFRQRDAQEQYQRYLMQQQRPWIGMPQLAQIGFVNSGQNVDMPEAMMEAGGGGAGGAMKGAMGGASTGAAIGSMFGPGYGTLIGAGIGAVGGGALGWFA